MKLLILLISSFLMMNSTLAKSKKKHKIVTNAVIMDSAPTWLKRTRVEKVTAHVQMIMEWSIRRIHVYWHYTMKDYLKAHNLGAAALAVAKSKDNSIHLGPKINNKNFDQVFGHELVHIISFQKYKGAIPKWLEEGLANYVSKKAPVNYKWLAKQAFPKDVRKLTHPFSKSYAQIIYQYRASQALAEMLAKKCDLQNLLRLSVERKMDDYIDTYCKIKDLNAAYKKWVIMKSKSS